jgi:hypothetical protein
MVYDATCQPKTCMVVLYTAIHTHFYYNNMTVDAIFDRYAVPEHVQHMALMRGVYGKSLAEAWVGPSVTWSALVKALVFGSLGESGAHIRKKIGLDKYVVTLITRGKPQFADMIARSHDLHQKLYAYVLWHDDPEVQQDHPKAWERIASDIEHNLLDVVPVPMAFDDRAVRTVRAINILHYKNPSV